MKSLLLFLFEAISNPINVGAAFPSSKKLANYIAKQVPLMDNGLIIELGGGTGVVTAALIERGIKRDNIRVIERSPALAKHLVNYFPHVSIIQGDACELTHLLDNKEIPAKIIISCLPLRSLPKLTIQKLGEQLENVLENDGIFIQFTYSLYSKPLLPSNKLQLIYTKYIAWNLPPARVEVFKFKK